MDIGFGAPVSGAWATPRNLAELARRAERLGYRSLWTFQRLLAPASAALAPVYRSVLDPMVSLGYLAAATSSIRLGVAVVNHPFASPLLLAKQAATVDVLSGGRLDLGIGNGWLAEEFTGSGAAMAGRGARADEYVAALRALWSTDRRVPRVVLRRSRRGGRIRRRCSGRGRRSCSAACPGGDGAGRADRRRVGHRVQRRPVQDRRVRQGGAERRHRRPGAGPPGSSAAAWSGRARRPFPRRRGRRRLLSGSYEQIREDVGWLDSAG